MLKSHRILVIVIGVGILISGYAFGRLTETPRTIADASRPVLSVASEPSRSPAPESPTSTKSPETSETTSAASENQNFYLSDFKTGYADGYNAGKSSESSSVVNTNRPGYNDGFKNGYADGYQAAAKKDEAFKESTPVGRSYHQEMVYRGSGEPVRRHHSSKLNTALTIAGPAAIGAGVGLAAGGGRGAASGALIGGGGGALYQVLKNRNRD